MGAIHNYFISGIPIWEHPGAGGGARVGFGGSVTPQKATEKALSRVNMKEP